MKSVLLIECSPSLRHAIMSVLSTTGHYTIIGATGEDGLHFARAKGPDLASFGMLSARTSGPEVLREPYDEPALQQTVTNILERDIRGILSSADTTKS